MYKTYYDSGYQKGSLIPKKVMEIIIINNVFLDFFFVKPEQNCTVHTEYKMANDYSTSVGLASDKLLKCHADKLTNYTKPC